MQSQSVGLPQMSEKETEPSPIPEDSVKSSSILEKYEVDKPKGWLRRITTVLTKWGIETHGIAPVPAEARTDTRWYQMFFVWFSANMNVLAFGTGTSGPAFYSLGLRDSIIILLIVDLIACTLPAYFAVFGPKLGTRAMVQSRFSWGYYGAVIPSILNVFSLQGFLILNCIIGGQTLASVSTHLNDTLGIVIIGILSLIVSFCGYRIIHWYESLAWIPNVIAFIVMLGVGGSQLRAVQSLPSPPATASNIISFASTVTSSILSWCPMTPDYGVYHSPRAASLRIFIYTYLAFFVSSFTGHAIGAAFAAASVYVPSWGAGLQSGNDVGGLFYAVLTPSTGSSALRGFGKFLTALVALSIPSACAPTMYSFGASFMTIGLGFGKVPRWAYALVSEAILIPVAIVGATKFYSTFVDILSVIGYWSSAFSAIVLTEHFIFRRRFSSYDISTWASPSLLPTGIPAVVAFVCAIGIIVPCMNQTWYEGPVAKSGTGDIGVFTGFVVASLTYFVFRSVEKWLMRTRGSEAYHREDMDVQDHKRGDDGSTEPPHI